jgi:hypothetical protein
MITKMLASAAILGSLFAGGTPASADPNQSGTDPNPFGGLTCNCQQTTPAGGPAVSQELDWGIQAGLSS